VVWSVGICVSVEHIATLFMSSLVAVHIVDRGMFYSNIGTHLPNYTVISGYHNINFQSCESNNKRYS
jgi:hypothetical protein